MPGDQAFQEYAEQEAAKRRAMFTDNSRMQAEQMAQARRREIAMEQQRRQHSGGPGGYQGQRGRYDPQQVDPRAYQGGRGREAERGGPPQRMDPRYAPEYHQQQRMDPRYAEYMRQEGETRQAEMDPRVYKARQEAKWRLAQAKAKQQRMVGEDPAMDRRILAARQEAIRRLAASKEAQARHMNDYAPPRGPNHRQLDPDDPRIIAARKEAERRLALAEAARAKRQQRQRGPPEAYADLRGAGTPSHEAIERAMRQQRQRGPPPDPRHMSGMRR